MGESLTPCGETEPHHHQIASGMSVQFQPGHSWDAVPPSYRPAEPRAEPATAAGTVTPFPGERYPANRPATKAARAIFDDPIIHFDDCQAITYEDASGRELDVERFSGDPCTCVCAELVKIEAEARAATPPALDAPLFSPESEHCHTCGCPVGLVWTASDDLWAGVTGHHDGGGIRCIPCFDAEATAQGRFIRWVPREEVPDAPDDKRQTCTCTHRYRDHGPAHVTGEYGGKCLALWDDPDVSALRVCTCEAWRPALRLSAQATEEPTDEHFMGADCECGKRHEEVCGFCHQPIKEGTFNIHRATECPAAIAALHEKAAQYGFDLVRR